MNSGTVLVKRCNQIFYKNVIMTLDRVESFKNLYVLYGATKIKILITVTNSANITAVDFVEGKILSNFPAPGKGQYNSKVRE